MKNSMLIATLLSLTIASCAITPSQKTSGSEAPEVKAPAPKKSDWETEITCYHFSYVNEDINGTRAFDIQHNEKEGLMRLVYKDGGKQLGKLVRAGLHRKFDWEDSGGRYSIKIMDSGEGYFFDWKLADKDGRMTATRDYTCK